jgi:hypothetical protein
MVDQQTIAAKIALLESVVWDILVDRFNSTPNPVSTARQYAETKLPSRHGRCCKSAHYQTAGPPSFAIFAAIRRALAGCTPGAAAQKKRREHGATPGEFGYEASTAKASRQSPIIVRSGTDSVNSFRRQIYKSLASVALKSQTAKPRLQVNSQLASWHPGVAVPHAAAGRSVIGIWSVSVVAIRVIIRPRRDCAPDDSTGNDSANHSSGTPTPAPAAPPGFRAA